MTAGWLDIAVQFWSSPKGLIATLVTIKNVVIAEELDAPATKLRADFGNSAVRWQEPQF